ncbi:hypothetical protein [Bifidobacterium apri]|uniref:Uncharacterized protein n=1 Tax=Bifidobacterium apri TaxID=1769423 RepID=A0A6A2W457_9BIFI|nr:hypothetical protein [Bifidobacterium apri]KAB8299744.1 hypothetical protein DSM100238_0778 [Bifidobacterium apri]
MSEVNNSDQDKVETVAMQQVDAAERPADTAVMPQATLREPAEATADTMVMPRNADTEVIPQAASQQDAQAPGDTTVMPQTASTAEPDVASSDAQTPSVHPAAPRTDIPLDELARQRQTAGEEPQQSHPLGDNTVPMYTGTPAGPVTAASSTAAVIRTPAPSGVNAGTVVLGVLLVVLGVAAIVMAGMVPNWPFGQVDPWVVAAVSIGVAGVALVVIAIVWAIINATASARRDRDKSADAVH